MILFFISLFTLHHAHAQLCQKPWENPKFAAIQNKIKTLTDKFSNTPLIAGEADQVLSQLIAAKSPAIIDWMKKRKLDEKSDTEFVKEWRRYYATTITLGKYPNLPNKINTLVENYVENAYNAALPQGEQKNLNRIFSAAKARALETIDRFSLETEEKNAIKAKVSDIAPVYLKKLRGSTFENRPLEAISWGVAYDPITNKINIGVDAMRYTGKETLFAVFAHEIAHSFDPCRWGAFFKGKYPFQSVIECLKTAESVGAKSRDDSKLSEFLSQGKITKELYESLKSNPTCNKLQYPSEGLQNDQTPESFADWFSAEVVAESEYRKPGFRSDLCETSSLIPGSSYPSNPVRLRRIYLAHPKLNGFSDTKDEKARYCAPPSKNR